jgi:hypothetical protein
MHTLIDVIALAKCSAVTAADQWAAFDDSEDAHLVNLYDTLVEHQASLVRGTGLSFAEILRQAFDTFNNKVALIAQGEKA